MQYCDFICTALTVATNAHHNRYDKGGKPYILHPLWVAMQFKDTDAICVSLLHDVIEDSAVTPQELKRLFPEIIVKAVKVLTRKKDEPYDDYIHRIKNSGNALALKVKLMDLMHNMDVTRIQEPSDEDLKRCRRYCYAYHFLRD